MSHDAGLAYQPRLADQAPAASRPLWQQTAPKHGLRHADSQADHQRPVPSPLQLSQRAYTAPDLTNPHSLTSPLSPLSPTLVPAPLRSARATDRAFEAVKAAASRDAILEQAAESRMGGSKQATGQAAAPALLAPPVAAAAPTIAAPLAPAPTVTSSRMASIALASRVSAKGGVNRTFSIDSTLSSLPSTPSTHSLHAQAHTEPSEPDDIPALIAAAGSPEAAIQKLLQEKRSASSHNAQLWRLVEKQRAMILGLNKDLERTMKDKDRYRKKFKDNLMQSASMPALASPSTVPNLASVGEESSSPVSRHFIDTTLAVPIASAATNADAPLTAMRDGGRSPTPQPADHVLGPSPLSSTHSLDAAAGEPAREDEHVGSFTSTFPLIQSPQREVPSSPPLASTPSHSDIMQHSIQPRSPQSSRSHVTSDASLGSSPISARQGFSSPKERLVLASRKAPPAPLDLGQGARNVEAITTSESSDSSYEDDEEPVSTPTERGRRKTRIDDDHDRRVFIADEQVELTESGKSSPDMGIRSAEVHDAPEADLAAEDGYTSSRCASPEEPGSPRVAQIQTYQSLSSLASMLHGDTQAQASSPADLKRTLLTPILVSPGLPLSPRPIDRPMNSPMSRSLRPGDGTMPVSPRDGGMLLSPRAPRQPIPLPPQDPLALASPHLARAESYPQLAVQPYKARVPDRITTQPVQDSDRALPKNSATSPGNIYRGFVSEQYPTLLLPPNALPFVSVKVDSSRLRPSRHSYMAPKQSEENPIFTLAIHARSDGHQLWRIEKTLAALAVVDQKLKAACDFRARLPERTLFVGHAPARIDARRTGLAQYFDSMLDMPMDEHAAMVACAFLSSDAIGTDVNEYLPTQQTSTNPIETPSVPKVRLRKDGYLTKKGKNFGGWKARYFVLDGPLLKYFEAPGGAQLGAIKLASSQIGRQPQQTAQQEEEDDDNQYRHAFLILEPKRKDSSSLVRHVLCAESDEERDSWVECLLQYVDTKPGEEGHSRGVKVSEAAHATKSPKLHKSPSDVSRPASRSTVVSQPTEDALRAVNYSDTTASEAPVLVPRSMQASGPLSPPFSVTLDSDEHPTSGHPTISPPSNGAVIENADAWGNKHASLHKDKKKGLFGFKGRTPHDAAPSQLHKDAQQSNASEALHARPVFGVALAEVAEFSAPIGPSVYLPAVVYRCIEYLKAQDAVSEEGIFRLSGSSIVIKALRERFNTEGDVKLLTDEQYYDIHAVASLLKLYLRELPASILTRELHLDFLKGLDLEEHVKNEALNVLVNRLPRANRELLEQLCAFLREIVDNERVNKMSVRNVGIVFSPTLNIPAPLISLFVTDHEAIFGSASDGTSSPSSKSDRSNQLVASAPHEPNASALATSANHAARSQTLSDLPTPTHQQANSASQQSQQVQSRHPPPQLQRSYNTGFMPANMGFVPSATTYEQGWPVQSVQNTQDAWPVARTQGAKSRSEAHGASGAPPPRQQQQQPPPKDLHRGASMGSLGTPASGKEQKLARRESGLMLLSAGQKGLSLQQMGEREMLGGRI